MLLLLLVLHLILVESSLLALLELFFLLARVILLLGLGGRVHETHLDHGVDMVALAGLLDRLECSSHAGDDGWRYKAGVVRGECEDCHWKLTC